MSLGDELEHARRSQNILPPEDLEGFIERYIYVSKGKQVFDTKLSPMHALMTFDEFVNHTASAAFEVSGPGGGMVRTPIAKMWLADSRRATAIGAEYIPQEPGRNGVFYNGAPVINTFFFPNHDETYKETTEPPSVFLEHMDYLFGEDLETALDFFAHMVQKPSERPTFVPYNIATKHGTGRGWVDSMVQKVIGVWNCSSAKIDSLFGVSTGGFSDFYYNTIWCNIGEIKVEAGKRFEVDDKLRDVLIDKTMTINPKYGKMCFMPVFTRTFLCSNHSDGLAIPAEDRRIWATRVAHGPKPSKEYDRLYEELKNPVFVAKIFYYLSNRDISKFRANGVAPYTATKHEIIHLHRSEPDEAIAHIDDAIHERFQDRWKPEIITTDQLYSFLGARDERTQGRYRAVLKGQYPLYLANDGDGRLKWGDKPVKVWILKNADRWRKASRKDVRAELDRIQRIWDESKDPFEEPDLEELI